MLTMKQVNQAIAEKGWKAEIVKDRDHFYVTGPDVEYAYSTTIGVFRLNFMDIEGWMREVGYIVEDSRQKAP